MPFRLCCLGGDEDVIGERRLLSVLVDMLMLCSLTSLSDSVTKELCEDRLNVSKIPEVIELISSTSLVAHLTCAAEKSIQ